MKPILIVQNCEIETAGTILDYLNERELDYDIVHSYRGDKLPEVVDVDTVINLGCPCSITNYREQDFLKNLYAFVSEAVLFGRQYLGICFGAQMLAHVLGAKVAPNEVKEIGTYRVRLTPEGFMDPLFTDFDQTFDVFHWHSDTFNLPFGAQLLVEGADCRNQVFRKGNLLGLQFHFEANLADVSCWCDAYKTELREVRKTKGEIMAQYRKVSESMQRLNFKLLDNFFCV